MQDNLRKVENKRFSAPILINKHNKSGFFLNSIIGYLCD
jgi:hypothetical protein